MIPVSLHSSKLILNLLNEYSGLAQSDPERMAGLSAANCVFDGLRLVYRDHRRTTNWSVHRSPDRGIEAGGTKYGVSFSIEERIKNEYNGRKYSPRSCPGKEFSTTNLMAYLAMKENIDSQEKRQSVIQLKSFTDVEERVEST